MKQIFIFFLLAFLSFEASGTNIEGYISQEKKPAANIPVSVSSTQTTTNKQGFFRLKDISEPADSILIRFDAESTLKLPLEGATWISIDSSSDTIFVQREAREDIQPSFGGTLLTRKTLEETGEPNLLEAIALRVAGVEYSNGRLFIRGNESFTQSNTPLYIIDGVETWDASYLTVNDVKSVEILKGANASFFGVKSSGGVIIIKTK